MNGCSLASRRRRYAGWSIAILALVTGCPIDEPSPKQNASVDPPVSSPEKNVAGPSASSTSPSSDTATLPQSSPTGTPSRDRPENGEPAPTNAVAIDPADPVAPSWPTPGDTPPFENWPRPDVTLFITGQQYGYIEPCGCTGLANAKGGLSRRFTLMREIERRGWDVVALDVGNQVRRFGRQAEVKFQTTVDVLKMMKYQAVGFGPDDLRLSFGEVYAAVADVEEGDGPFVSANVSLLGIPARYRVISTEFGKLGITSVLGTAEQKNVGQIEEIELSDPRQAFEQVLQELKDQSCDYYILLAHASIDESKALARAFPRIDLVVTAGGASEPALEPESIDGSRAPLIQVGKKGMYVGVVGLYRNSSRPMQYQRVALDAQFEDSSEVLDLFASYQNTLEELGLEGLGLRPVAHPTGRRFVGSAVCGECHTQAYEIFQNTPHFEATRDLAEPTERSNIPRHHDPECLSCHVTGWNPQGYFPYDSGYLAHEQSALHSTGCESCHGPGSEHVAAERGEDMLTIKEVTARRAQLRITLAEAKQSKCFECHDLDNSPDFQKEGAFEEYWQQVEHYGRD